MPALAYLEKSLAYAETHPEVKLFRKVGKPVVALRFLDKAAGGQAAPPPSDDGPTEPEPL